ncbi:MAG: single-stranded DNA-binding protein [Clostridia bacterium]|nr:single-stranded DNA-binding protein [Clostridia bacterium]
MNKVILMGRLARDPELRSTPNGVSVCTFALAVSRRFKNANGEYDADFINCVAWRQTAEFISKNFAKGRMLGVVGSLQTRSYDKDGQKRYVTEVSVDEAYFAGDRGPAADEARPAAAPANNGGAAFGASDGFIPMPAEDDLPF